MIRRLDLTNEGASRGPDSGGRFGPWWFVQAGDADLDVNLDDYYDFDQPPSFLAVMIDQLRRRWSTFFGWRRER